MKYLLFIFLQFCLIQTISAQVTGKVINAEGKPVIAATVLLLKSSDSSVIKTTVTNGNGNYLLESIPVGKYMLQITGTGYESMIAQFELVHQQNKDLGKQIISATMKELEEVTVRSQKPMLQQTAEGLIVNAESSILTKGSNVLQVLERSPGIVINRRDNSIELNGKTGVTVMLNGKLIRMSESQVLDLLAGMSADDIATIELLSSPSAKYDAEGSAGLINIVLKKNKHKGTNGSASVTAGYGYRGKAAAGFNLSRNTDNINFYGSYTFSHNAIYSSMYVDSWQDMPFLGGEIHALGLDTTHSAFNNHNATIGIDVTLNAKTTIGAGIIYSNNKSAGAKDTYLGYNILPDSLLQYNGRNAGKSVWNNIVSSVYMERLLRKDEKLSMNIDYLYFNHNAPYEVHGTFVNKHGAAAGNDQALSAPAQRGFAKTSIRVFVGKIDYAKQFGKNVKLDAGIKSTYTQSSSYSGFESLINGAWTNDPQAINNIVMKEGIGAAYASLNSQINPSTNLVTGLRYEYAYTNMNNSKTGEEIVKRRRGVFFPNIFFTRKISERSEAQLSYSKRITRPSYNDLASYVGYNDPTAVYTGNPFLQPTITHNIKLGYKYKNYTASLLFSRDKNAISRYQLTESPAHDMLFISPQNISWQNNLTFQTNLPVKINNWWMMNYGFVGGLRQYKVTYTKQPFEHAYFCYSVNYSNSFKMPQQFSAELSGSYNNVTYNGTQKVEGILRLNLGIKKELANNKGSIQLSVTDILQRELYDIHYGTLTEEAFAINNHVIVYTESTKFPVIRVSYSRSFGNNKSKAVRSTGSNDEQERIRKE
jgi:iron complex outermembrane recepter protein